MHRLRSLRKLADPVLEHRVLGPVVKLVAAYILVMEVTLQLLFGRFEWFGLSLGRQENSLPRGVFINGAIVGSLYALVAIGIILVHRANRIVNFAQSQLGAVPAVTALLLIALKGWSYWLALPVLLIGAVAVGAVVEVAAVRRFRDAPRLILTVATIGVGFILLVAEFGVKQGLSDQLLDTASTQIPTPWKNIGYQFGIYTLTGDAIAAFVVVVVLVSALGAFLRYTDMGIAIRASAENGERAALLGIPTRRVSLTVWIIATVLSAVGIFFQAPLFGLPLNGYVGLGILLYGLTIAVLAKMEHVGLALIAGLFVGSIDAAARFVSDPALAQALMLLVILGALLLQRADAGRARDSGASTWQNLREVRPIPVELRGLSEVRLARSASAAGVALVALAAPFLVGSGYVGDLTRVVIYAMIGISLVILTGWAGQISLGQFAIAGVGAAVAGGLAANHHWDFFATLLVAGMAGAAIAILVGLPALRIQGLLLAVTTLAFAFAVPAFLLSPRFFPWLLPGDFQFVERPVLYGAFDVDSTSEVLWFTVTGDTKYFYLCLVFLVLAAVMARSLRRQRSGRVLVGVRDNPKVLQALGVSPARTRLFAFAVSGFIAAVAGALFAYQQRTVDSETFTPEVSILLFVMCVIGGMGSITGAVLGTVFVVGLPLLPGVREIENVDFLISGGGLLILLSVMPGGLAEGLFRLRDNWLRKVAAHHGIHVPSLVADSRVDDGGEDAVVEAGAVAVAGLAGAGR